MGRNATVTRSVWKTAKLLFKKGYKPKEVMYLTNLSNGTVYKIKNSDSYKGINGYYKTEPKNKYDNVMREYIVIPPKPWSHKLKRKDKK